MLYIYQYPDWTKFRYQQGAVANALCKARMEQGKLLGVAAMVLFAEDAAGCLEQDLQAVFFADSLELQDSVKEKFLATVRNFGTEVTDERLSAWHASCVRGGGRFRNSAGTVPGVEPERIPRELSRFLRFFNESEMDEVLKAAISMFWFLTIRPFENGNLVLAWLLAQIQLSKSENSSRRFYSLFAQMLANRPVFDENILKVQSGNGEITPWLLWFVEQMNLSIETSKGLFGAKISGAKISLKLGSTPLSSRELDLVRYLQEGSRQADRAEVSSTEWAKLAEISHDSALRDLQDMVQKGVLEKTKGGRGTRYRLAQ